MAVAPERIYQAVKSGRVKVDQLNNESKQALKGYLQAKKSGTATPSSASTAAPMANVATDKTRLSGKFGGYDTPMDWADNTFLGSLFGQASEKAGQTSALVNQPLRTPSSGNKTADKIAQGTGSLLGFFAPGAGGVQTVARGMKGAVGLGGAVSPARALFEGGELLGAKVAPRVAAKVTPRAAKVVERSIRGGTALGTYGAGESLAQGESPLEALKQGAIGAGIGAGLGVVGGALADKFGEAILKRLPKSFRTAPASNIETKIPKIIEPSARLRNRQLALPPAQNFTFRDLTPEESIGRVLPKRPLALPAAPDFTIPTKNTTRFESVGPLRRSTTALTEAETALNEGIQKIQNQIRRNDVLAAHPPGTTIESAISEAELKTGVNLKELISRYEQTEKLSTTAFRDLPKTGSESVRWANVAAGISPPKLSKLERPLEFKTQIPKPFENQGTFPPRPLFEEKPLQFKRTIEVPKVYDKSSQGLAVPRQPNVLDGLANKEAAATMENNLPKIVENARDIPKEFAIKDVAADLKDKSGLSLYTTDVYRNFKKVFGKNYDTIKKAILDPFDAGKKEYAVFQRDLVGKLKTEVVDKLGIEKGKKLSALVQKFGEKRMTLEELQKATPNDWQKVVEADRWFRKYYDQLIDEINAVRATIYPNVEKTLTQIGQRIEKVRANTSLTAAEKADQLKALVKQQDEAFRGKRIPKRDDYYRHFTEISDTMQGAKNLFETPAAINPSLAGVSDFTQPKSKFLSLAQKRLGGKFTDDAVGGFLNYIPAAAYAKHIDPHISTFRKLADDLADATGETKNLNNFIEYLRKYANDLSGKTNDIDRAFQTYFGRKTLAVVDWVNRRIKANMVLANIGSAMSQLANVPQGVAYAKQHSILGLKTTIQSIFTGQSPIKESGFMSERTLAQIYRQFDTGILQQPKKIAVWMLETADRIGSEFIWNSVYQKAISESIANPIKYADDVTRSLIAGRGVGEVPLLQKSKLVQTLIPFTLEVANLWRVQKDFLNRKDVAGLLMLYASNWVFNEVSEKIKGMRVTFDPIDAFIDAFSEEGLSPLQRGGRLAGEVISSLPAGQFAASLYPEYGFNVGEREMPTRKELFGRNDPTRFGPGLLSAKGIRDPLTYLAPPFGGAQASKTLKGIDAIRNEGVYSERPSFTGYAKELITGQPQTRDTLKYPVKNEPTNILKGLMFGPGGFSETKDYYDNDRRPLSEQQTKLLKTRTNAGYNQQALYDLQINEREESRIEREMNDIVKDKKLTSQEKKTKINDLRRQRVELFQARQKITKGLRG